MDRCSECNTEGGHDSWCSSVLDIRKMALPRLATLESRNIALSPDERVCVLAFTVMADTSRDGEIAPAAIVEHANGLLTTVRIDRIRMETENKRRQQ